MTKSLSEALEETVKEIQGYSQEELRYELNNSEKSTLAKTINEILAFELLFVEERVDEL